MWKITGIALLSLWSVAGAGLNSAAELYIDFNGATPAIDSVAGCATDSTAIAAIVVQGASHLFDYQCYIQYDTVRLKFVSGLKGTAVAPNFLESNSGIIVFTAKKALHDSTRILASGAIIGSDQSLCPTGKGVLGLLTFTKRTADTAWLSIVSPLAEDCDLSPDSTLRCHRGCLVQRSTPVAKAKADRRCLSAVSVIGGSVRMQLPGNVEYEILLSDAHGRTLLRYNGHSDKIDFNARRSGGAKIASGVVIARIRFSGEELALPLVM